MHDGVAVVAYDCKKLRLLRDCRVDGTYGFVGTTTKKQTIAIKDVMELRANVASVSERFEAEIERGSKLDVALAIVGKTMSTRRRARPEELIGNCKEATHIVSGATVGAFYMQASARNKAGAGADIFSIGANAAAVQSQTVSNRDGDLPSCDTAKPDDKQPPKQCNALLRLDLMPLEGPRPAAALVAGCPEPLVWSGGACVRKVREEKHVCRLRDASDCQEQ